MEENGEIKELKNQIKALRMLYLVLIAIFTILTFGLQYQYSKNKNYYETLIKTREELLQKNTELVQNSECLVDHLHEILDKMEGYQEK